MTNDVPATDPTTTNKPDALLTFPDMVRSVPSPRGWLLKVWNQADPDATEPHHIASLPISGKLALETWLAHFGAPAGTYRVELDPVAATTVAARRHRLDRLQQRGPTTGIVQVTAAHTKEASELAERTESARRGEHRPAPRADESLRVKSKLEETALQRAENERLAAELENKRLHAEMKKLERGDDQKPAPSPFSGIAAIIAPFAPVLVDVVRTFLDNQRAQAEALREVLTREPPQFVPQQTAPAGLTLASIIELVPQLKELAKFVGGMGGGQRDDDERPSEAVEMLSLVRDVLGQVAAPSPEVVAEPIPAANGAAKRRRPSPEEAMNLRVLKFMLAILNEQRLTADPATTADKLFAEIGTLPEEFRALLATSETVEALLSGLPKWLPPNMRVAVPNAIRQDPRKHEWLATFLDTVHELASDAAGNPDAADEGSGAAVVDE